MENEAQLAQQLIDQLNEQDRGTAYQPQRLTAKINKDRWWITAQGVDEPLEKLDKLEAQILNALIDRSLYLERGGERKAPDCYSPDGGRHGRVSESASPALGIKTGQLCATCPFNQWGTGKDEQGNPDEGKACKERRLLQALVAQFDTPIVIQLPTSSIKEWDAYADRLTRARPASSYIAHITELAIQVKRKATREWGVAVIKSIGKLDPTQIIEAMSARREALPLFQAAPLLEEVAPSTLIDDTESPF